MTQAKGELDDTRMEMRATVVSKPLNIVYAYY